MSFRTVGNPVTRIQVQSVTATRAYSVGRKMLLNYEHNFSQLTTSDRLRAANN